MVVFKFVCKNGHRYEVQVIRGDEKALCPTCGSAWVKCKKIGKYPGERST